MKQLKYFWILFTAFLFSGIFMSCSSEITVEMKKDGSAFVQFNGLFGEGVIDLITSASDDDVVFDTKQISYELVKSGFSDVNVVAKGNSSINISMKEKTQKSYLFTSGLLSVKNGKLMANLSPKTLKDFYSKCDEQIILYLDLLLAPIFNDEESSEADYIETIAAIYGEKAAKEFENSSIKMTVKNADGTSKSSIVSVAKLLTLQETIGIE